MFYTAGRSCKSLPSRLLFYAMCHKQSSLPGNLKRKGRMYAKVRDFISMVIISVYHTLLKSYQKFFCGKAA